MNNITYLVERSFEDPVNEAVLSKDLVLYLCKTGRANISTVVITELLTFAVQLGSMLPYLG